LGAGRWRIVRQLLIESSLLAGLGLVFGVLAARWFIGLLSVFALPGGIHIGSVDITISGRMLAASAGLAALTALGFGTAPAFRAANTPPAAALRTTRTHPAANHVRRGLITAQVALSLALLIGAALFVRSVRTGLRTELGFDATRVAALSFGLRQHGYDVGKSATFYRTLLDRVGETAGIEAVALATHVPLAPRSVAMPLSTTIEDQSDGSVAGTAIAVNAIIGDYFRALGIPLRAGRVPALTDDASAPKVAVVNEATARALWPSQTALGRQFQLVRGIGDPITVIGIVADAKSHSLLDEAVPYVYIPALQHPNLGVLDRVSVIARGQQSASQALTVLRREVEALDQTLPVFAVRRVRDQVETVLMPQRFGLVVLTLFGSLALLVSAVGVYGVVAYTVTQRRFEIGVRNALGARGAQITVSVVRDYAIAVSAGVLLGLVAALLTTRLLNRFLFGVSALDFRAFTGATAILCAVAALAAWLPARRAARMDPTTAIRAVTD
jgi:predicted permease